MGTRNDRRKSPRPRSLAARPAACQIAAVQYLRFSCIVALALALFACGDDDSPGGTPDGGTSDAATSDGGVDAGEPPPERCGAWTAPGPGPSFRDATSDWGVPALEVRANRVAVADLDGDGYPDVIVHRAGQHNRADFTAPPRDWPYRVLMNRAKAGGGRELVDRTIESQYGALREPVAMAGRAAHLAVFGDVDDDGDLDAFSGTYANRNDPGTDPGDRSEILLNDGSGTFTLAPPQASIAGSEDGRAMPTSSATFLDDDRDGRLDLFVGYWYANYGSSLYGTQDRLLHGAGDGTFADVTDALGLTTSGTPGQRSASRPTYGVTACDVDLDGDTDLLGSAYGRQWNQLWLRGDAEFTDVAEAAGFDGDDNQDYSDNEFYRCYCQTTGSCTASPPRIACDGLYWGAGTDDQPFRLNGNTFTTACGDVDSDGDVDLYSAEIVHWHIGASSDSSELLVRDGTTAEGVPLFTRPGNAATGLSVPHVGVSWNEGGITAALADLDNDGRMDVLLGTSDYPDQKLWIYRQQADGTFAETAVAAGVDHACAPAFAVADLDRDGDLDLAVGSSTARDCAMAWPDGPELRIYENTGASDANWIQLHLEGAGAPANGASRSAIGAIVRVTAGGVTRTREVQSGYGHFGVQNDMDVTIGLGDACAIDELEIRWPDAMGTVERFTNVRARYRVVARQGSGLEYVTE